MSKIITSVSIDDRLRKLADEIMELRKFNSFTGLLEQLIREEHDRRHGPASFRESSPPYKVADGKRAKRQ